MKLIPRARRAASRFDSNGNSKVRTGHGRLIPRIVMWFALCLGATLFVSALGGLIDFSANVSEGGSVLAAIPFAGPALFGVVGAFWLAIFSMRRRVRPFQLGVRMAYYFWLVGLPLFFYVLYIAAVSVP